MRRNLVGALVLRSRRHAGVVLLACGLSLAVAGCSDAPPEPPSAAPSAPSRPPAGRPAVQPFVVTELTQELPDQIGPFVAAAATRVNEAEAGGVVVPSAARLYRDGQREVELHIFDTHAAPVLARGLIAARQMEEHSLDTVARAEDVGDSPGLLQWSRSTGESEFSLLHPAGVLVTLKVWPADTPEHAMTLFAALDLPEVTRRRRVQ